MNESPLLVFKSFTFAIWPITDIFFEMDSLVISDAKTIWLVCDFNSSAIGLCVNSTPINSLSHMTISFRGVSSFSISNFCIVLSTDSPNISNNDDWFDSLILVWDWITFIIFSDALNIPPLEPNSSNEPHLIRLSKFLLLQYFASVLIEKSSNELYFPFSFLSSIICSIAFSPTFFIADKPKRILGILLLSSTLNFEKEALILGGRTSILCFFDSLMHSPIFSGLSVLEFIIEQKYSTG